MEAYSFSVIFSGVTDPYKDRADIIVRFIKKSRLSARRVDKMFSSKEPVTIKTGLSEERAQTLKAKLESIGMRVSVVPEQIEKIASPAIESPSAVDESLELVAEADDLENEDLTLSPVEAALAAVDAFTCPKCGQAQVKTEQCANCGVYFSKLEEASAIPVEDGGASPEQDTEDARGFIHGISGNTKKLLGLGAVAGGFLFFILKKFGMLKIFFVVASLSYAFDSIVDESITMCLGDSQCEEIVNDTAEDCWQSSGMDQYDWDNMSDSEFEQHYKQLETSFYTCLVYPDGSKLFLKPAYLTAMLVDFCNYEDSCLKQAGQQQRVCYQVNELDLIANQLIDLSQDEVFEAYREEIQGFLRCFVDDKTQPLFPDYFSNLE